MRSGVPGVEVDGRLGTTLAPGEPVTMGEGKTPGPT